MRADLGSIFNPMSIAIVGVSTEEAALPKVGQRYFKALLDCGFEGRVYPINPKGGKIWGSKLYENIRDIPDSVDYVVSCVPALATPQLIKDCAAKRVKAIHVFASGFSETGTEQGKQLEEEICLLARQHEIRIIGPNCLGVYCPKTKFSFRGDFPKESGAVALICQSGGNTHYIVC